jgi:peptidoglycan/xylan/chitin deacetylase (PgdA/CDA1 family)
MANPVRSSEKISELNVDKSVRFSNGIKALQFHRITPKFQFCGTWNKPGQFERFLEFLCTQGIEIILPGQKNSGVIITFDDGEKSIYDHAFPILKKYNIKALVFLIVDYIGKKNLWDITLTGERILHLSWHEISEMKKYGIEFGSHTMTHRNLTKMSKDDIGYELFESKRILEQRVGECSSVSYPYNRCNQVVTRVAADAGYKFGFGGDGSDDLCLKKEAIYITDNSWSISVKVFEKPDLFYAYERIKQKIINYFTIATMVTTKRGLWKSV